MRAIRALLRGDPTVEFDLVFLLGDLTSSVSLYSSSSSSLGRRVFFGVRNNSLGTAGLLSVGSAVDSGGV